MAVVKAHYRVAHRGGRAASRAALEYARSRPDREQQPAERPVFTRDAGELDAEEVLTQLRSAEGTYHYRLILNPGEGRDTEVDLQTWTRDVMQAIEERQGAPTSWWAVAHDNHSAHDHVHVVAVLPHRLNTLDLDAAREAADQSWERHQGREQALSREAAVDDLVSDLQPERVRQQQRQMDLER